MESRVFSNCTRNIHRPPTPEKVLKKSVNLKQSTVRACVKTFKRSAAEQDISFYLNFAILSTILGLNCVLVL